MTLLLASGSVIRLKMLRDAGVAIEACPSRLDEQSVKTALDAERLNPRDLADALAEAKAFKLSQSRADTLVLGADQVLELDDGGRLDKPASPDVARAQLAMLSGKTHRLHSAAVIAQGGRALWREVESVKLHVRPLDEDFIANYVAHEWDAIRHTVGCYEIEGRGVQLFTRVEGSHFAVLGLPLLSVLGFLRAFGAMPS